MTKKAHFMPISRTPFVALATLAVFGFAARPAAAQYANVTYSSGTTIISSGTYTTDMSNRAITLINSGTTVFFTGTAAVVDNALLGISANPGTILNITGGTITNPGGLCVDIYGSTGNISGGIMSTPGNAILADSGGVIDLFGTFQYSFNFSGPTLTPTAGQSLTQPGRYNITGTLRDGNAFNHPVAISVTGGTLEFNVGTPPAVAPEPSPAAVLAMGLMSLGALAMKAKKRTA